MKIKHIISVSFAFILLVSCKKEPEKPYPDENIIMDNVKATVYFHTVFREAENAWAFIDQKKYESDVTFADPASTSSQYKKLTYDENTDMVTVEYNAWVSANLLLVGNIYVKFEKDVYRTVNNATATVTLGDFSINGQMVTGGSKITYQKVENSETDRYNYALLNGVAIYEQGNSMPILISATMNNGRYERIEGYETLTQDDDIWTFSGTMTGKLGKDQILSYTNTIQTAYQGNDGEKIDGTVRFTPQCDFAEKGISEVKITGRPDIIYEYACKEVFYFTVTHVD